MKLSLTASDINKWTHMLGSSEMLQKKALKFSTATEACCVRFPLKDRDGTMKGGLTISVSFQRMDFGAGCVQLWICSTEPPGEHPYENGNNISVILTRELIVSTPAVSQQNYHIWKFWFPDGWINFHTFTFTGNIALCWEPDPLAEKFCL